ncbi:MAG: laminin sub domain 2, partial [Thermoleophilia bacterium]|nr:laminin sub domain 2 [Thermoleophilia bacterium]
NDTSVLTGQCYQYQLVVTDRVGNFSPTPPTSAVRVDTLPPSGSITAPLVTTWADTVTIAGTASDAHSGMQSVTVSYAGPSTGTIATCNGISVAAWNTGCAWNTTDPVTGVGDGAYVITVTIRDVAGNTFVINRNVTVDNTPPNMWFASFAEGAQGQYQATDQSITNLHWYNPDFSGDFTVRIWADDSGGTGVANVTFPPFGGTWTNPGGLVDNTAPSPYAIQYNWAIGSTEPGTVTATGIDNAGKSATQEFSVRADAAAPTGGSLTVPNGPISSTSVSVTFNEGSDSGSGIGGWRLERADSLMTGGACPAVGAWTMVGGPNPDSTVPFVDSTLVDGRCYQYRLVVEDRVLRSANFSSGSTVIVDDGDPSGTINGAPASPFGNTVTLTGTATDTATGPAGIQLRYIGATTGTICSGNTPLAGPFPATSSGWSCNWNTTGVADGTYTLDLIVTDGAGNVSIVDSIQRGPIVVDNTPPVTGPAVLTEVTGLGNQHVVGTLLWYNPAATGSVRVSTPAVDTGTGVNRVEFPALGAGWTPGGGPDSGSPYEVVYTWTPPGVVEPGPQQLVGFDNAGKSSTTGFTMRQDTTPPGGGSITVTDGIVGGTSTTVSFTGGTDSESGVIAGNRQLQRRDAPLTAGICGTYTVFGNAGIPAGAPSPYTDNTLVNGRCYQYQLIELDNVGNPTIYSSLSEVRVDGTPPTGNISLLPAGPWSGNVNAVNGDASDLGGGVDRVEVTYSGPASGTICSSPALVGAADPRTWSCAWNTNPGIPLPDGSYTITLRVWDTAGTTNSTPITRTVTVDNNAPSLSWTSFGQTAGAEYLHNSGSNMFYNPAGAGSFTVSMTSVDLGTGVNRVDFPLLGTGWSPAGGSIAGTFTPHTMGYSFTAGAVQPGTVSAISFDNAGNSTGAPGGNFTVTADNAAPSGGGLTVTPDIKSSTSTTVSF